MAGELELDCNGTTFYQRGDTETAVQRQRKEGLDGDGDVVARRNHALFDRWVDELLAAARINAVTTKGEWRQPVSRSHNAGACTPTTEAAFHDSWADGTDISAINVRHANEACTAPEMRHIVSELGDLRGKSLLDVGAGLGEAGVYFALLGADVTVCDISPGMLNAARRLGELHGVSVQTCHAAAEDLGKVLDRKFDVVYAGNLLHHVDVDATIKTIASLLKDDGIFVSWDPIAYNPVIGIYRWLASDVRTPGEHPLTKRDLKTARRYFDRVNERFFWLSTLSIFLYMFLIERRHPGKERYWKSIVEEAERWETTYHHLERLDRALLSRLPVLNYLCWNVALVCRRPRR